MNIQREKITQKHYTSGTTLLFFSTHLDAVGDVGFDINPSILEFNNQNIPIGVSTFDGSSLWKRDSKNIHRQLSSTTSNYITGHSYTFDKARIISESSIENIKKKFTQGIANALLPASANTIISSSNPNPFVSIPAHREYVFASYHEIDDFFVDIKLNRTFGTLDTLNIYNNLVNSFPIQEANTGVVFGRLLALQNIKDADGNNIRIPLRNTPIGIFNASEDYPLSTSVTDNGDRLFLNLKESAKEEDYFNIESFALDKDELLRSASQFTTVPDQYKYITTTNDEGEFVIYDVPVGSQIAVFEVDLLKQGLTRDEIALNFFGFPPDEDAIVDKIPSFLFKQFPVNVVPAWGTIQTGYTELNIVVNADLRKWTTYHLPPVTLNGEKLEAAVAVNSANSLKVQIRDMTKEGFPKTNIKFTQIQNDLDKVFNQQFNWHLEFPQIKNNAEFFKFGIPIIKLPANIYDPDGYRTDTDGIPTNHKGVWLSAYQLNMHVFGGHSRKTGSIRQWVGGDFFVKSHFDINHSPSVSDSNPGNEDGNGYFPYEKPWTKDYPNKYKIPAKPTDQRYQYVAARTPTSTPGVYYLDEPAYNDGDMVGYEVNDKAGGGFGSQSAFGKWFHNRIAEVCTKNFMYKYEAGVAWNETYANGYQPNNPSARFAGVSKVLNGEKYQRFESGYGYWFRPSGWPRTQRTTWGADTYFGPDISHGQGLAGDPSNPGPGNTLNTISGPMWASYENVNDVYNMENIQLALCLSNFGLQTDGTLEAYRIIDANPDNLMNPKSFLLPTWVRFSCNAAADRLYSLVITNTGEITVNFMNSFRNPVFSDNTGDYVDVNSTIKLNPGESIRMVNTLDGGAYAPPLTFEYTSTWMPGNADYNPSTNRYDTGKYRFRFDISGDVHGDNPKYVNFYKTTHVHGAEEEWFVKTNHAGGNSGITSAGVHAHWDGDEKEVSSILFSLSNAQVTS